MPATVLLSNNLNFCLSPSDFFCLIYNKLLVIISH